MSVRVIRPATNGRKPEPERPPLPYPKRARELQQRDLPATRFAVAGLLPEGVTMLAGAPKQGKSWLSLNIAIAVAAGGVALGDLPVGQGDVLLLALENNERNLKERLDIVLEHRLAPEALEYQTEWPNFGEDRGEELLTLWCEDRPNRRLIIVDTLQKLRPPSSAKLGAYEQDYAVIQPLTALAAKFAVSILLIHHTRKASANDPVETVSGTYGLSGAVDALWVLQRVRGQANAVLAVTGRNVREAELGMEWDEQLCTWRHAGEGADVRRSRERQSVITALRTDGGHLTAREVAMLVERPYAGVRKLLWLMTKTGEVHEANDGFFVTTVGTMGMDGNAPAFPLRSHSVPKEVAERSHRSHTLSAGVHASEPASTPGDAVKSVPIVPTGSSSHSGSSVPTEGNLRTGVTDGNDIEHEGCSQCGASDGWIAAVDGPECRACGYVTMGRPR